MALTKIGTDGVKDDAITSGKIPANAVGSSEIADDAVDTNAIQDDAVTADKLANSINTAIAANTAKTSNATHTGDVTGSTSLTIANDAVTEDKIGNYQVTGFKLGSNAVSTTKIADEAVTLAKLEHGTSSNNGKFLRANNAADPSFESLTEYDDANIRHDISMLALHVADGDNKTAFTLSNSVIDNMETAASMQNANGVIFKTGSSDEYWQIDVAGDQAAGVTPTMSGLQAFTASNVTDGNDGSIGFHTDSAGSGSWIAFDLGSAKSLNKVRFYLIGGNVNSVNWELQGSSNNSSWTDTGQDFNLSGTTGEQEFTFSATTAYRYWRLYKTTGSAGGGYHTTIELHGGTNSTAGTIQSNTYTASSSRSQVAGVLLYRDVVGTNTLGTNIEVYFSCDNGSNWTEASSYTAMNLAFKTGVKAVTLGKTTCTAGTQIRFKVELVSQNAASKVAGVQGLAMQF